MHRLRRTVLFTIGFLLCMGPLGCWKAEAPQQQVPSQAPINTHKNKLIGGQPSLLHPAVGALTRDNVVYCSATLIAPRVVLSAAHCIDSAFEYNMGSNTLHFRIDTEDSQAPNGYKTHYFPIEPSLLERHPQWVSNRVQRGYDVGVAILKTPVPSNVTTPIPFNDKPLNVQDWTKKDMLFLGYGLISAVPYAISPNRKHSVMLNIEEVRNDRVVIRSPGKSVCHGDSGGPALGQMDGELRVLAVNSYALTGFAEGSNPPRTRCDDGAVSVRTDSYAAYIQGWVNRFKLEAPTCKTDADCGSCGTCDTSTNQCKPKVTATSVDTCKACNQNSDCKGGQCVVRPEGKRCLPTCDSNKCCPEASVCLPTYSATNTAGVCQPWSGVCPKVSCQSDQDCSDLETCQSGSCQRKTSKAHPKQCHFCKTDGECGNPTLSCSRFRGEQRCLQRCSGNLACPKGFQCRKTGPGRPDLCLPTQPSCPRSCQADKDCGTNDACNQQTCLSRGLSKANESCEQQGCEAGLACVETRAGKRCLKACHVKPGEVGGACKGERTCASGSFCLVVRGTKRKFCAQECKGDTDCKQGGSCTRGFCVCRNDSECSQGAACHNDFGSDTGFCVQQSQILKCPDNQTCQPFTQGSYCIPSSTQGTRWSGQSCDSLVSCQDGLECLAFGRHAGLCGELCRNTGVCRLGGRCIQGYCLCLSNNDCPQGRICRLFLDVPNRAGVCVPAPNGTTPCVDDRECEPGQQCNQGKCGSPVSNQEQPAELAEEPTTGKEPVADTANPQEPAPEPSPNDASDAVEKTSGDTTSTTDIAVPPPRDCGCSTTSLIPSFWLLGFALFGLFRHRRKQHFHLLHLALRQS